jgi:sphingomyelin phosphodiesterase 2
MGDFNMIPSSMAHRIITSRAPVRDCWRVLHPDSALGPADDPAEMARRQPVPTAEYNLLENGIASDGPFCTWRWNKPLQQRLLSGKPVPPVDPDTPDPHGKRLDYIFAGSGDVEALGGGWVVSRVAVGMTMRHPELGCSLSDHFAVEATLTFHAHKSGREDGETNEVKTASSADRSSNNATKVNSRSESFIDKENSTAADSSLTRHSHLTTSNKEDAVQNGAYLQSPTSSSFRHSRTYDRQLAAFSAGMESSMPLSAYDTLLGEIKWYRAREQSQQLWRGRHFFAWVAVLVGCLVAVWFVPHNGIAFALMLVSSLGLAGGTVDGLLSLLFFGWELRALNEFEWEIMNAKASAGGGLDLVRELQDHPDSSW